MPCSGGVAVRPGQLLRSLAHTIRKTPGHHQPWHPTTFHLFPHWLASCKKSTGVGVRQAWTQASFLLSQFPWAHEQGS